MTEFTSLSEIKTTEIGAKSPESGSELRKARGCLSDICSSGTKEVSSNNENVSEVRNQETDKVGGRYADIHKNKVENTEDHHCPADSASELSIDDGPAIKMDKEDHMKTASWGRSKEAQEYREKQKDLFSQGKFKEAVQMDIEDIRSKFGDKYEEGISQMLEYVDKLEQEHKI